MRTLLAMLALLALTPRAHAQPPGSFCEPIAGTPAQDYTCVGPYDGEGFDYNWQWTEELGTLTEGMFPYIRVFMCYEIPLTQHWNGAYSQTIYTAYVRYTVRDLHIPGTPAYVGFGRSTYVTCKSPTPAEAGVSQYPGTIWTPPTPPLMDDNQPFDTSFWWFLHAIFGGWAPPSEICWGSCGGLPYEGGPYNDQQ